MMSESLSTVDDRSLGELFAELTREIALLVRQEASLAKAEITEKAAGVGKNIGMLAAGGAVAYAGLLALVAAAISLLTKAGMPWWGSALLVGVVVMAAGSWLVWSGLKALKQVDLVPRRTLETVAEEKQWINRQAA